MSALPAGTLYVGAGLAVLGLAAYVFLAIAGHDLSAGGYGDLSVLWVVVFSVGPGVFFPLEQELGRLLAARAARGLGTRPVVLRIAGLGTAVLLVLVGAVLVARRPLADALFGGDTGLVYALAANLAALTAAHTSRGLLAGSGRFGRYGVQLALDGTLRCVLAGLVAGAGIGSATTYGLVLAVAPLMAVAATVTGSVLRLDPGPAVGWRDVTAGLGLLAASSLLWLSVVNASVVTVRLLSTDADRAVAGAVLSALVLARIPLFAFSAVQASLLPALSAAVSRGDRAGYRRLLVRTAGAVSLLGAGGVLVGVALGPWLVRVLFGGDDPLGRADFAWFTVATGVYMIATVFGYATVALGGHAYQAIGWAAGFAVLVAVSLYPAGLLTRVELAFLAGSAVAAVVLAALLVVRLRRPDEPRPPVAAVEAAGPGLGLAD